LLLPFLAGRLRARDPVAATHLVWATIGSWVAVNLPFALAAPGGWWEFFRFNSARPTDWDSLWFIGCHRTTGALGCTDTRLVNVGSALLFVTLLAVVWRWKAIRDPGFPRWTLGLPILVLFLLTNKVYSPQYGLWLLPWLALALPSVRLFVLFSIADVAVFVTRFWWFARLTEVGEGVPIGAFEIAVVVRAAVLVTCVVAWVRRREPSPAAAPPPPALELAGATA
jgi:uncharacterized membrane protein